jgi:heat shock protein HslJ
MVMETCRAGLMGIALIGVCACVSTSPESVPASVENFSGVTWVAEDIDGRGVIDNAQSTIEFTGDDRVAGRGGCNRYSGSVTIDGRKLKVAQVISTKMACVPALMDQETRFLQALESAASFEVKDTKLIVRDATGTQRLVLDKQ